MAILKHISSKNANYGDAEKYLTFEHDEFTMKPTLGADGRLIFTGGVAYAGVPKSLMSPAMALPLHLYLLLAQGATSFNMAYGTAFVMMAIILISNILVTIYASRSQAKWNA